MSVVGATGEAGRTVHAAAGISGIAMSVALQRMGVAQVEHHRGAVRPDVVHQQPAHVEPGGTRPMADPGAGR
ncbi:hypothetical protein [Pseudonocardia sp.]|uniref:hypothetical protein n=1 Tax=Pseudonocardia sp. TaxID=60912 RepID=UPI002635079F|nr:hypothetical protein [Pseudonocardia sp.]MCW2720356.1 hypothetical protein [Pseudonocardia sp.]